jgi:hypothetical protein
MIMSPDRSIMSRITPPIPIRMAIPQELRLAAHNAVTTLLQMIATPASASLNDQAQSPSNETGRSGHNATPNKTFEETEEAAQPLRVDLHQRLASSSIPSIGSSKATPTRM